MEDAVFVWPVHLLTSLYGDLVGGAEKGGGFIIEHKELVENGEVRDRLTIKIHCETELVPGGRIDIEVSGEYAKGFESDRSAILAVVEALRTVYGIFPSDFSYALIAEKRPLFTAMQEALQDIAHAYFQMDEAIAGYISTLNGFTSELQTWLNSNHEAARVSTVAAVRAMHSWSTKCADAITRGKTTSANVVAMMPTLESLPAGLRRLDRTAPMPMMLNWEASYEVMRLEFNAAMAKLRMQATEIEVSELSDGKYKASIAVSGAPYHFTSEAYHSALTTKARLMYTALKYMHEVLGCGIIDLNHEPRIYIENHIRQFDHHVNMVWKCAGWLVHLNTSLVEQFTRMLVDVESRISVDSEAHKVLEAMADSGIRVAQFRDQFGLALRGFIKKKVDKATMEHLHSSN